MFTLAQVLQYLDLIPGLTCWTLRLMQCRVLWSRWETGGGGRRGGQASSSPSSSSGLEATSPPPLSREPVTSSCSSSSWRTTRSLHLKVTTQYLHTPGTDLLPHKLFKSLHYYQSIITVLISKHTPGVCLQVHISCMFWFSLRKHKYTLRFVDLNIVLTLLQTATQFTAGLFHFSTIRLIWKKLKTRQKPLTVSLNSRKVKTR